MIEIDGSFGEGGGQILRTSLTLSALTKKPFRIYKIRANRPKPGLQRQHLTAVEAVKKLTNAKVKGDFVGSTELVFEPEDIVEKGDFEFDVGTAGSVTLILQTILPLLINRNIKVTIKGGTDVPKSPSIDYIRLTFLSLLEKIGIRVNLILIRRGHYPEGGGEIKITEVKGNPSSFSLMERGELLMIKGISHVSSLPSHIAERQAKSAKEFLLSKIKIPVEIEIDVRENERSKGSGIALTAIFEKTFLGSDSLGEKGKRAEIVGEEAAKSIYEEIISNATVDRHMSDMLMLYASLYYGEYIGSELTSHARTNSEIIKKFLNVNIQISGEKPFIFRAKKEL
ncbi:RNA 3'-terminal phosphate cyclase [Sulfurisphaera tokodaii]|uniref:RNA 3'-terminal phosphate cyclase n=2 Tax=Sulfurisphaera tokodaii TaxID=111955 RepID=RTCA_SULTO|nr:RNA 3'-terminal phosphate cyclase [Sulfurisphaera tokodaii]Q974U1.1 RecName: Full=RNA 3'-terminal phosphate cyclase; Short=RNA cyclase; Short=RNA-3'-phosphate cyclase [Sulfurisphaera tokodaii str. 7]BAB65566.1 probable RNA 3'-terminal phosphate cyclase [Sulfurisphaera tokodaii str. 7]HII74730.1 RNA 3'-terminal phosphate cyclase [Sulfurisphaera tokodaii]